MRFLQSSIIRIHNCLRADFRVVDGKGTARGTHGNRGPYGITTNTHRNCITVKLARRSTKLATQCVDKQYAYSNNTTDPLINLLKPTGYVMH